MQFPEPGIKKKHPLYEAIKNGDLDQIRALVQRGCNPDQTHDCDIPPLHYAVREREPEAAATLVALGANPDLRDNWGRTPIHHSLLSGEAMEYIRPLLKAGADINAQDRDGQSALHYTAKFNQDMLAATLVQLGGDPFLKDKDGKNPAETAYRWQHYHVQRAMLKAFSDRHAKHIKRARRPGP